MPQIRYIRNFDIAGNELPSTPYEVSDEQLAHEAEQATCEEYLKLSPLVITQPQIWYLLRAFSKKLGYIVKET